MNIGKLASKATACVSYPFLGNLSRGLQEKIGEAWEQYDPIKAKAVSAISNMAIYPAMTFYMAGNGALIVIATIAGAYEAHFRFGCSSLTGSNMEENMREIHDEPGYVPVTPGDLKRKEEDHYNKVFRDAPFASTPGIIVSKPLEYLISKLKKDPTPKNTPT
ncbi:hypothetical protein CMO93_02585 [Candidatus Woesearchaeota archaeon]|nr:hypothetical protein [Candidatus Woesearchaeota archaeon]|tara:strand:- start:7335 stop:7820 length:486 start_codon:yes stop_codon:yes gene_type:complete